MCHVPCFQLRICYFAEQVSVSISNVTSNSVVVSLSCGLKETDTVQYSLESEQAVRIQAFNLTCGNEIKLPELKENTEYNLTRYYSKEIKCPMKNFTMKQMQKNGEKIDCADKLKEVKR